MSVFGDVNADLLKQSCSQTKLLLSVMKQLQHVDLVCVPTRITDLQHLYCKALINK